MTKYEVEIIGRTIIIIEANSLEEARKEANTKARAGVYDEAVTENVGAYSSREYDPANPSAS